MDNEYVVIVDALGRFGHQALDRVYRTRCENEVQALRPIVGKVSFNARMRGLNKITDGYWYAIDPGIVAITVIQVNVIPFKELR